jgi:hypothetical protein
MNFDFKNMETYHYFIAGGAGLVVIAILLYFLKGKKVKVSAFFATTIGAIALGFGIGVITLGAAGYHWEEQDKDEPREKAPPNSAQAPKQKNQNPNPKNKDKGGGNTPSAKLQLAAYIVKLNQLTEAPLTINLADRKAKVAEQLKDLDSIEMLSNEEAQTRLNALKEVLDKDNATLDAAGLDLARAGAVGKGKEPPANPFKDGTNKTALNALRERLGK